MHRFSVGAAINVLILITCLGALSPGALASTAVVPNDDNMIIGARVIVRAKVLSVGCALDQDRIFTYTSLKIREVLKGRLTERKIVIKERGGILADRGSVVFGTPQFVPDEEVILYLVTWPDGSFHVYQMFLGKFSIVDDPETGRQVALRSTPDGNTIVVPNADQSRGTITDRMELSSYVSLIRERLNANAVRAREFEDTWYRDVPVRAEPPEYGRILKQRGIEPRYTFLSPSEPARWFEPDTGQPVVFRVNPNEMPNPQTIDDINAAMNAWSVLPGCSLRVINAGTTGACELRDENTIIFDNCDGGFAPDPSFCSGILALGGFSWDRTQSVLVNGTRFFKAYGGHISFNKYARCSYEEHCNVRLIATHEMGHALGLGHSQFQAATMFAYANFDGRCAGLHQDDINGITFIYPGSGGGGPGPLTIATTSPIAGATIGTLYSQTFIAYGGTAPYTWTLVPDTGALPPGLVLGTNGVLSGTASTSGGFTFTIKVGDAASGTAQRAFSITVGLPGQDYNSQFMSQTVPANLQPGQSFTVNIKWNNTGTRPWNGSAGFRLGSQNPANNVIWGGNIVQVLGFVVQPGEAFDLAFTAFAPLAPGRYNFQWQCVQDNVFFGETSPNVTIQVGDGGATDNSAFVSETIATSMTAGQAYAASITMRNTGATTWTVADYKLGTQNPQDNNVWGMNRLSLPGPVAPGEEVTVNFGVTAPANGGTYNFQWQMIRLTSGFFGAMSTNAAINVVQPSPPPNVTTSVLSSGEMGMAYSQQLNVTGGTAPYTWTLMSGALPGGVSLATTGVISGSPTATGTFAFAVRVTDAASRFAERSLSITVTPPPLPIVLVTTTIPAAVRGNQYSVGLVATGGTPPYTWSLVSGVLAPGLSLDSATGVISGTPTTTGVFSFTIGVRDQRSTSASTPLQLTVLDPVPVPLITKVKYQAGKKKLTVTGERFDATVMLLVDGVPTTGSVDGNVIVVKKLGLSPGQHTLKAVNPRNTESPPYGFRVD